MKRDSVARAQERLRVAEGVLSALNELPPGAPGFEEKWYIFLSSFNSTFSQLEQGSKSSQESMKWYAGVKSCRRSSELLCYLHHARNAEEHTSISTIFRTKATFKPLTNNVYVRYRDSKGRRLEKPAISSKKNSGKAKLKFSPAGVRLRTVVDRGRTYSFPKKLSDPLLCKMVEAGDILLEDGSVPLIGMLRLAVAHLGNFVSEAAKLVEPEG